MSKLPLQYFYQYFHIGRSRLSWSNTTAVSTVSTDCEKVATSWVRTAKSAGVRSLESGTAKKIQKFSGIFHSAAKKMTSANVPTPSMDQIVTDFNFKNKEKWKDTIRCSSCNERGTKNSHRKTLSLELKMYVYHERYDPLRSIKIWCVNWIMTGIFLKRLKSRQNSCRSSMLNWTEVYSTVAVFDPQCKIARGHSELVKVELTRFTR